MPSKSKTKGNKFERDIRDFLNNTYDTEEFSRTPNSGAIMGRSNWGKNQGLSEGVKRTLGSDIIVADDFHFAVECKHYADKPNYAAIIKGNDSALDHWLAEVVFDAINLDLHPMLFFKTNRKGTHVAVPGYFITEIQKARHFLKYESFLILGIETFEELAKEIRDAALNNKEVEEFRTKFYELEYVQELLKTLDD